MPLTNTRIMFLTTIVLRVLVMFLFLPRISEEGAWPLSAVLKDIAHRTKDSYHRRVLLFRVKLLRRHARRKEARNAQSDHGEE